MLNIITGRTGSGKTRYIRSLAAQSAQEEKGKTVIVVPEQFSFETEKGMLSLLGNEKINNVEIFSFSRLAERLLTDYGRLDKKIADDGTRAVVPDGNLSVALHGQLCQPLALAIPSWHHLQLVNGDMLFVDVTCKVIVYSQGLVYKVVIEILCASLHPCCEKSGG